MLVLTVSQNEDFLLQDDVTGRQMKMTVYFTETGRHVCGFEGSKRISITRIKRVKAAKELPQQKARRPQTGTNT